jgi:hypothetical protein
MPVPRWGPCCSVAPQGRRAASVPSAMSVPISGQVRWLQRTGFFADADMREERGIAA